MIVFDPRASSGERIGLADKKLSFSGYTPNPTRANP